MSSKLTQPCYPTKQQPLARCMLSSPSLTYLVASLPGLRPMLADDTEMSPQGVDTVKRVLSIWSAGHPEPMGNMDESEGRTTRHSVRHRNAWGKVAMSHALARSLAAQDPSKWSSEKVSLSLARRMHIAVRNTVEDLKDLLEPILMWIPLPGKVRKRLYQRALACLHRQPPRELIVPVIGI